MPSGPKDQHPVGPEEELPAMHRRKRCGQEKTQSGQARDVKAKEACQLSKTRQGKNPRPKTVGKINMNEACLSHEVLVRPEPFARKLGHGLLNCRAIEANPLFLGPTYARIACRILNGTVRNRKACTLAWGPSRRSPLRVILAHEGFACSQPHFVATADPANNACRRELNVKACSSKQTFPQTGQYRRAIAIAIALR